MKGTSKVILEVEKEERKFELAFNSDAPLGDVFESCQLFMREIVRLINESAAVQTKEVSGKEGEKDDTSSTS